MSALVGRTIGFGYLLRHHPWLLLIVLVVVVAIALWMQRRER